MGGKYKNTQPHIFFNNLISDAHVKIYIHFTRVWPFHYKNPPERESDAAWRKRRETVYNLFSCRPTLAEEPLKSKEEATAGSEVTRDGF